MRSSTQRGLPFRRRRSSGQVLPLSLVCLMLLILFAAMMFKVGRLVLRREQTRNRADLVAYGAGVDYARSLNLLSLSNKPLMVAAAFAWTGVGLGVFKSIQKIQDLFAGIGISPGPETDGVQAKLGAAWLVEGSAIYLGRQNGLWCKLLWNDQSKLPTALLPSLNVRRRRLEELPFNLADLLGKISGKGDADRGGYQYHKAGSPDAIQVPTDEVKKIRFKNRGKWTTRYRQYTQDGPGRYVSKVVGEFTALDVVEVDGNHSLTLWAISDPEEQPPPFLGRRIPAVPALVATSRVRVGGGSMDFWDVNAGSYAPFFAPVDEMKEGDSGAVADIGKLRDSLQDFHPWTTGLDFIDRAVQTARDKVLEILDLAQLALGRALH